jgi:hypothetical protein
MIEDESFNLQVSLSTGLQVFNSPPAMPFDPAIPAPNAEATSAMFRGQFNGLKDLIDAVPTITSAVVDNVNTLPAGDPAAVTASITGGVLHLSFGIPTGPAGEVTQALLDGAIQTTSANSNSVNQLNATADLSYQSSQMQEVMNKLDELIWALRR